MNARGTGQGPRTQAQVFSKKVFKNFFQAIYKISTIQKIVVSSSRGQSNFQGLDLRGQGLQNVSCPQGRSRGQGRPRGLHLWRLHSQKSYVLRHSNLKNAYKNCIFSKYDIMQIR